MSDIACRNLCKTFHQGEEVITALDHVSLDMAEGSFACLSGPSGSGKTTLLNALGGLDTPDSGEITVGDQRLDQLSRGELADLRLNHIGFVFQAYNLIPVLSAQENIEFIMQVQGVPAQQRRKLVADILAEVGLAGMEGRRPAEMSGGQQQQLAIGRALVTRPKLLILDEPTEGIQPNIIQRIGEVLSQLCKEQGMTILIVEQYLDFVKEFCDRFVLMNRGRVVATDEIGELREELIEEFLHV